MNAALALWVCFTVAGAGADDSPRAVTAGRDALSTRPAYPWYDSETDRVKPIKIREPRKSRAEDSRDLSTGSGLIAAPLQFVAWFILAALLAGLAAALIWAWRNRPDVAVASEGATTGRTIDRVGDLDALPAADLRDAAGLRAAAEAAYRDGRYREAMIYLYSLQLLSLDQGNLIRLARGKTNRQYLRELPRHDSLRQLMSDSVDRFEVAFFGGRSLERIEFEECWNRLGKFNGLIAEFTA